MDTTSEETREVIIRNNQDESEQIHIILRKDKESNEQIITRILLDDKNKQLACEISSNSQEDSKELTRVLLRTRFENQIRNDFSYMKKQGSNLSYTKEEIEEIVIQRQNEINRNVTGIVNIIFEDFSEDTKVINIFGRIKQINT